MLILFDNGTPAPLRHAFKNHQVVEAITMSAATVTEKGQIVIPAEIRARYELTPGTQVEFVDEGGVIRLLVRRRVPVSDPVAGFGLVKVKRTKTGNQRRLSQFDSADLLQKRRRKI